MVVGRLVGLIVFVGLVRPIMQMGHVGIAGAGGGLNTCVAYLAGGGL